MEITIKGTEKEISKLLLEIKTLIFESEVDYDEKEVNYEDPILVYKGVKEDIKKTLSYMRKR